MFRVAIYLKGVFKIASPLPNIKQLAYSIANQKYQIIKATMPLPKKLFQWAADIYWTRYGKRFGTSKKQMQTMEIEGMRE